jgi:hypothetical protein
VYQQSNRALRRAPESLQQKKTCVLFFLIIVGCGRLLRTGVPSVNS